MLVDFHVCNCFSLVLTKVWSSAACSYLKKIKVKISIAGFVCLQINTWYLVQKKVFTHWTSMNFMKHQWSRYISVFFCFFFLLLLKKKKKQKQPTTIHGSFWPLINVTYFYIILELTDLFNSMEFPWHVLYEGLYFLLTYFYKIGYLHQALCFSYREVRRSFKN